MARRLFAAITFAFCLLAQGAAFAAPGQAPEVRQLSWAELSAEQKRILAPVGGEWNGMQAIQRKRLLDVAKRYPKMKPNEQQRIQTQLKDWAKLTHEERALARKKYEKLKQLPPEKRQEVQKKWQEYQQLPEEQKAQLRRGEKAPAPVAAPLVPDPLKAVQEVPKAETEAVPAKPEAAKPTSP